MTVVITIGLVPGTAVLAAPLPWPRSCWESPVMPGVQAEKAVKSLLDRGMERLKRGVSTAGALFPAGNWAGPCLT